VCVCVWVESEEEDEKKRTCLLMCFLGGIFAKPNGSLLYGWPLPNPSPNPTKPEGAINDLTGLSLMSFRLAGRGEEEGKGRKIQPISFPL